MSQLFYTSLKTHVHILLHLENLQHPKISFYKLFTTSARYKKHDTTFLILF